MKRVLCFLLVLVLLGASLLGVTAFSLIKESDNVNFTLIDERGDRRALQGISAQMSFTLHEKLNWEVSFTPFEKTETEYDYVTFYPLSYKNNNYYYGFSTPSLGLLQLKNENAELKQLVEDLREEALENDKRASAKVNFCDYYEYYPVNLNVSLPGISIEWYNGFGMDEKGKYTFEGISPSRGQGVINAFNDYFRIPVGENDVREISVLPNDHGNFSYQTARENTFDFNFYTVRTDSHIYFSFENEINTGHEWTREFVDTSLIPGGYGIYSLPYTENDIKYEELKTVYSVPSDATVEALMTDESRQELYLVLHKNEKLVLHIIDMSTMADKSEIELFDFSFTDYLRVSENEDFFVFIKNDVDFNVVAINDGGKWESALTGTVPSGSAYVREFLPYRSRFGFDGERLVVWVIDDPGAEEIQLLSLQPDVMVFTKDGLQYYGKWICSLGDPIVRVYRWESVGVRDWKVIFQ